jgi:hypothetical protein
MAPSHFPIGERACQVRGNVPAAIEPEKKIARGTEPASDEKDADITSGHTDSLVMMNSGFISKLL